MSFTIPIQQAARQLEQLLSSLGPGDEIVLTRDDQPVAKIVPSRRPIQRRAGSCKGMLVINQDDDDHLKDFKDYMP